MITINDLNAVHQKFKQGHISGLTYTYQEVLLFIDSLHLSSEELTKPSSSNGLDIPVIKLGNGSQTIMAWGRMHGDEPTATKALLDLIVFLKSKDETVSDLRNTLLDGYTWIIIPILNPDGMVLNTRYTHHGIDLNRDATVKYTKEAQLMASLREKYNPVLAFNMHDQNPYYRTGLTGENTMIALLAPPIDAYDSYSENRMTAAQLITSIIPELQEQIPNKLARWTDDFESRAFGEFFQKAGASTILIEGGFDVNDLYKEEQRKLNFSLVLAFALRFQSKEDLPNQITLYEKLSMNERLYFDLIFRNVHTEIGRIDFGINFEHKEVRKDLNWIIKRRGTIEDWGDLSVFKGHYTLDFNEFKLDQMSSFFGSLNLVNLKRGDAFKWDSYSYELFSLKYLDK